MQYHFRMDGNQPVLMIHSGALGQPVPDSCVPHNLSIQDEAMYDRAVEAIHANVSGARMISVVARAVIDLAARGANTFAPFLYSFFNGDVCLKVEWGKQRPVLVSIQDGSIVIATNSILPLFTYQTLDDGGLLLSINVGYGEPIYVNDASPIQHALNSLGLPAYDIDPGYMEGQVFLALLTLQANRSTDVAGVFRGRRRLVVNAYGTRDIELTFNGANGSFTANTFPERLDSIRLVAALTDPSALTIEVDQGNSTDLKGARPFLAHRLDYTHEREHMLPANISDYDRLVALGALTAWPEIDDGEVKIVLPEGRSISLTTNGSVVKRPGSRHDDIDHLKELLADSPGHTLLDGFLRERIDFSDAAWLKLDVLLDISDYLWLFDTLSVGIHSLSMYRIVTERLTPVMKDESE